MNYFDIGTESYEKGNLNQAIGAFNFALAIDSNSPAVLYGLGRIYSDLKDYDKAIKQFYKAIELEPYNPAAIIGLGNALVLTKEYDKAIKVFQLGTGLNQTDINYSYSFNGLGNSYYGKEKYTEAKKAFNISIKYNPNYHVSHYGLGRVYHSLKEYEKAKENYKISITLNPNYSHSQNGLGNVYFDLKDYEKAIIYYKKAIEVDPCSSHPYYGIGLVYNFLKEFNKARKYFKKSIALGYEDPILYHFLGLSYIFSSFENNKYTIAQNYLEQFKNYEYSWFALFYINKKLKNKEAVDIYWKASNSLQDQSFSEKYLEFGENHFSSKNYTEAFEDFKLSFEIEKDLIVLDNIAKLYSEIYKNESYDLLKEDILFFSEKLIKDKEFYYGGYLYLKLSNYENAIKYLKKSLKYNVGELSDIYSYLVIAYNNDNSDKVRNKEKIILKYKKEIFYHSSDHNKKATILKDLLDFTIKQNPKLSSKDRNKLINKDLEQIVDTKKLDLSGLGIEELPKNIKLLNSLENLDLSKNNLKKLELPLDTYWFSKKSKKRIANLYPKLKYINYSYNSELKEINPSIFNLVSEKELRLMDFTGTKLSDPKIVNLTIKFGPISDELKKTNDIYLSKIEKWDGVYFLGKSHEYWDHTEEYDLKQKFIFDENHIEQDYLTKLETFPKNTKYYPFFTDDRLNEKVEDTNFYKSVIMAKYISKKRIPGYWIYLAIKDYTDLGKEDLRSLENKLHQYFIIPDVNNNFVIPVLDALAGFFRKIKDVTGSTCELLTDINELGKKNELDVIPIDLRFAATINPDLNGKEGLEYIEDVMNGATKYRGSFSSYIRILFTALEGKQSKVLEFEEVQLVEYVDNSEKTTLDSKENRRSKKCKLVIEFIIKLKFLSQTDDDDQTFDNEGF